MTSAAGFPSGYVLIDAGTPIAGSMSRTAATVVFFPGTSAVLVDDRIATCLREVAEEAASAVTGPRERARAGAALAFAVEHSVLLSRQERRLRADGFFTEGAGGRMPARELADAVVGAARRSAEERRLRHLGYLVAEVAVSPDVDVPLALRALRLVEPLSWRQLGLLAAVGRRTRLPLSLTPLAEEPGGWVGWGAAEDLADLRRTGLLDPPPASPLPGGSAQPRLRPADLRLTRRGVLLHRLLALDFVREEDATVAVDAIDAP